MGLLDELTETIAKAEKVKAREDQMLEMFKLAGFDLNHDKVYDTEGEAFEADLDKNPEPGEAKDLVELLKEALGNPPTEPGQWIRIKDIPRYISENLSVPEDLDAFNDGFSITQTNDSQDIETPRELKPLPKGLKYTKAQYNTAQEVSRGKQVQDIRGDIWTKEDDDQWTLQGDDDKGGYLDMDVEGFAPLQELAPLRSKVL